MNSTVKIAREYIGTPYHHQARVKYHGVDCVGLVLCVAKELNIVEKDWDITGYSRVPDGKLLMHHLKDNLQIVEFKDMQVGDIICVAFDKFPQHVGIVGDYVHGGFSIIHADSRRGQVIETRLLLNDKMRFVAAFRWKDK